MNSESVLNFWFQEIEPKMWWKKDAAFDELIRTRFMGIHQAAARGELFIWRASPHGRLAEIIILDQFSRNMFRDSPAAFAYDNLALALAQEAVHTGCDQALQLPEKTFLYMPYMHSESPLVHNEAVKLFSLPGLEGNLEFEFRHKAIIDRFGRYPHRNAVLGRQSTAEELQFLQEPGSSF